MEVVRFNQEILEALINCGFEYCYIKTIPDTDFPGQYTTFLTPVGFKPDLRTLPVGYDTYFNLSEEPRLMVTECDNNTTVYVNLDSTLIRECYV